MVQLNSVFWCCRTGSNSTMLCKSMQLRSRNINILHSFRAISSHSNCLQQCLGQQHHGSQPRWPLKSNGCSSMQQVSQLRHLEQPSSSSSTAKAYRGGRRVCSPRAAMCSCHGVCSAARPLCKAAAAWAGPASACSLDNSSASNIVCRAAVTAAA